MGVGFLGVGGVSMGGFTLWYLCGKVFLSIVLGVAPRFTWPIRSLSCTNSWGKSQYLINYFLFVYPFPSGQRIKL